MIVKTGREAYRQIHDLCEKFGWDTPIVFDCVGEIYDLFGIEIDIAYNEARKQIVISVPDWG